MKKICIVTDEFDAMGPAYSSYLTDHGIDHELYSIDDFAQQITLEQEQEHIRVLPECSIFLRPIQGYNQMTDEESRFCRNESFAAVWSAAVLSPYPVINRPNEWGWGSYCALSANVLNFRMKFNIEGKECFWHGEVPDEVSSMLHQDLQSWQTVSQPDPTSFYRSRLMKECIGWEQVVVVSDKAFRVTMAEIDDYRFQERSIEAVNKLRLQFATVSWGITANSGAFITRINPFPSLQETAPVWDDVCESLTRFFQQ